MGDQTTLTMPEDLAFEGDPEANAAAERLIRQMFDERGAMTPARRKLYAPDRLGSDAMDMPVLKAGWLSLFPDFPFHVKGRRFEGEEDPELYEVEVYMDQRDLELAQGIVDIANDQIARAFKFCLEVGRGDMPVWRQPSPSAYRRYADTLVMPEKNTRITLTPIVADENGEVLPDDHPFKLTTVSPIFPEDPEEYGYWEATTDADLDARGNPIRIGSALRTEAWEGESLVDHWWEVDSVLMDGTWVIESITSGPGGPSREHVYRRGRPTNVAQSSGDVHPGSGGSDSGSPSSFVENMPIVQWIMRAWRESGDPGCFGCLLWLLVLSVYLVLLPVDLLIGFLRWRSSK